MATTYLPRVTAADHEVLRRVVGNYPADSYEKWLSLQTKEKAYSCLLYTSDAADE